MQKQSGFNVRTLRRPAGSGPGASRRFRANWPAELRSAGTKIPCTVIEISSGGASVKAAGIPTGASQLWLVVEQIAPIPATLAWREKGLVGLSFTEEQPWVADSYRRRFDASAWIHDEAKGERG